MLFSQGLKKGPVFNFAKRCIDIVGALVGLILFAPVMLVAALALRLERSGPVFYRQERIGLNGKPFMMLKFRSMRVDAEQSGVPRWASEHDPRITPVGRIIRKVRIDEFPQFFNVLRGDMSLVGPRPERPHFVKELSAVLPFYQERHLVRPGITGWAQVNFHYGASLEDAARKHAYDLYYLKHRSISLDLIILLKTVRIVLFAEGAL
jgi:exopolysaccharide biosynthesis polyprenyl glycosylphosphotransferase